MTIYMVDIDGTICYTDGNKYKESKPKQARIEYLNELFDKGDEIHYWTARGAKSGIDWIEFTKEQLKGWGVKFTSVKTCKPHYDLWIDDKATSDNDYFWHGPKGLRR
tara:strand:- start:6280 stop:6600 length:321 start_codon:yes stop_codon:yes gene_type:complete